ncbi:MAG: hypothetical protein AAFN77_17160 [Planctomycetota bacterium]
MTLADDNKDRQESMLPSRLSRIETLWSVVHRAHDSKELSAAEAQDRLLRRYDGAIRRYLFGAVRDHDLADELFQQFAYRFVNGEFKSVDPAKGRFRSFVKTILFRMVATHFRKQGRSKEKAVGEQLQLNEPIDNRVESPDHQMDELFLQSWREEVLNQTWAALEDYEIGGGGPYYTVLTIRVENPSLDSQELADVISAKTGKSATAGSARVLVHRSRDKFANLLIDMVANSLVEATDEAIEEELIDLRLIDYCRDALNARNS